MGVNGVGFNVRLQVVLVLFVQNVRRINKVIKNQDNFPCGDDTPYLFDQVPNSLVTFDEKSTVDLLVMYVPQYFERNIFVFNNTVTFFYICSLHS